MNLSDFDSGTKLKIFIFWPNKGHLGELDKDFRNRDRHHQIRRQVLRISEGLILILAQS